MNEGDLKNEMKIMLVEHLMLKVSPEEIDADKPLFSEEGLGLDSIDALEIVVALEKRYGIKIPNSETARQAMASVTALAEYVREHRQT